MSAEMSPAPNFSFGAFWLVTSFASPAIASATVLATPARTTKGVSVAGIVRSAKWGDDGPLASSAAFFPMSFKFFDAGCCETDEASNVGCVGCDKRASAVVANRRGVAALARGNAAWQRLERASKRVENIVSSVREQRLAVVNGERDARESWQIPPLLTSTPRNRLFAL